MFAFTFCKCFYVFKCQNIQIYIPVVKVAVVCVAYSKAFIKLNIFIIIGEAKVLQFGTVSVILIVFVVLVKIVVDNDTIYEEEKPKTTTNISQTFSAKGTVTIKVYVDDILKGTKEINMNTTTTCTFE